MREKLWCRPVWLILTLLWMVVIFLFSCQNGAESLQTSSAVTDWIAPVVIRGYREMSAEQQCEVGARLGFLIRKGAHFSEYAVLGALLFLSIFERLIQRKASAWSVSVGISALYAVSDEFHQSFSDGRVPALTDVLIDSVGACVGALGICFLLWWVRRMAKTRRERHTGIVKRR